MGLQRFKSQGVFLKYSFIIPYWKRIERFNLSLMSYKHWYSGRPDVEFIVIEDGDNAEDRSEHKKLVNLLRKYSDALRIRLVSVPEKKQLNPVISRNRASLENAEGTILVHTSPEVFHKVDVLKGFDEEFKSNFPEGWGPKHPHWGVPSYQQKYRMVERLYVVCGCENVTVPSLDVGGFGDIKTVHLHWLQHASNNRSFHFCSAISKKLYMAIGGFDEEYAKFCGYDDNDFVRKISTIQTKIVARDDLLVAHIDHERIHHDTRLTEMALNYYNNKWG